MRISFKRVLVFIVSLYSVKIALQYVRVYSQDSFSIGNSKESRIKRDVIVPNSGNGLKPRPKPKQTPTNDVKTKTKTKGVGSHQQRQQASHKAHQTQQSYFVGKDLPDDILRMKRPDYDKNYKNPCWHESSSVGANSTLRCLPYFRIIGVDKCGTTDLWYRISKHPEMVRPKAVMGKETHWWSWRRFGFDIWVRNKPIRHFDWYLQHFDPPSRQIENHVVTRQGKPFHPLITGEGSPTEFWDFTGWPLIPQNLNKTPSNAIVTPNCLHHLTPDLKAIVLVRNPTDRAYSDYLFLDQFRPIANLSAASFHRDVIASIKIFEICRRSHALQECLYSKDLHMRMPVRLIPGLYDLFLSRWLQVFPSEQILVIRNEDYSRDIQTHLHAVVDFLQMSPLSAKEASRISNLPRVFEKTQRAKSVGAMFNKSRDLLDTFYKRYNQMLANRLKDSGYLWKS